MLQSAHARKTGPSSKPFYLLASLWIVFSQIWYLAIAFATSAAPFPTSPYSFEAETIHPIFLSRATPVGEAIKKDGTKLGI